jgi:hypothetical protein
MTGVAASKPVVSVRDESFAILKRVSTFVTKGSGSGQAEAGPKP